MNMNTRNIEGYLTRQEFRLGPNCMSRPIDCNSKSVCTFPKEEVSVRGLVNIKRHQCLANSRQILRNLPVAGYR